LAPGGRLALQTITTGDVSLNPSQQRDVLFLLREIFPYSRLPALSEIMAASSGRLELVRARNDRADYARTLRAWKARLASKSGRAVRLIGEGVTSRYERYLQASADVFDCGGMNLCRFSLANSIALSTILRMKAVLQLAHTHLLTTKFELRHRWHC
jgi:cyclopropane-fatty-acyl-phospholipid synthase